jgi:hypothetical protein
MIMFCTPIAQPGGSTRNRNLVGQPEREAHNSELISDVPSTLAKLVPGWD